MKERPILFSGPMVRAILEGRKTQTRRVVKMSDGTLAEDGDIPCHDPNDPEYPIPAPDYVMDFAKTFPMWRRRDCPYGKPGGRLWVRETWANTPVWDWVADGFKEHTDEISGPKHTLYKAIAPHQVVRRWRPSIHMPRSASRITLEVVSVRVERLQDISEEDAKAEGVEFMKHEDIGGHSYKRGFQSLWESINGSDSWSNNPWVWVVEFKRVQP